MNQLLSLRTNIFYSKSKDKENEEYKRFHELILLVDQPDYIYTNDGEIVRQRKIAELRLTVNDDSFDAMIKQLLRYKDIDESELV